MLSSTLIRKPINVNKSLHDYCKKSTEESIRKLDEKYNLERNKPKVNKPFQNNSDTNFLSIFLFLSITMFSYCFYKRLC